MLLIVRSTGGCIVGPGAACEAGPFHGGGGVDAEDSGEQRGRDLGSELHRGSVAHLACPDADAEQPFGQGAGRDVLAGPAAGEQPVGGQVGGRSDAAVPGQFGDEGVEGFGQLESVRAEGDGDRTSADEF